MTMFAGPGRSGAGGLRVYPREPEDQFVRDPWRPAALGGHQQPAESDRPCRTELVLFRP